MTIHHRGRSNTRCGWSVLLGITLLFVLSATASAADAPFPGKKTAWNGFDQYDFPLKDARGNDIACRVVTPKKVAKGRPWIWRARFWAHEPQ
ncbi:MAG: hypothetical protein VX304_10485, partial [Planctomycetota bacterium]|nr:hypothetical protein [Planctomycetota bacterium]